MNRQFGNVLKELRIERNMTQEEVAKHFGTGKSTISHYESNRRLPDANIIATFADFFGVSIDFMLGKSDKRNTQEDTPKVVDNTPKVENMFFAERLRYLMVIKDLTADFVSKKLGIEKAEFMDYAKGIYFPTADILKKIAIVFEISLDYLIGVTDDIKQNSDSFLKDQYAVLNQDPKPDSDLVLPDYIEVAKSAQDKKVPAKVLSDFIKLYLNRDK